MRISWKLSLFNKLIFCYFFMIFSNAPGIKIEYDNLYFIPTDNYNLEVINSHVYIRPDWLLYAVNGKPIPEFKRSPVQSIRVFAQKNNIDVSWNKDSRIIKLHKIEIIPPDGSLKDIYALIFYPVQFLEPMPLDFTWTLSSEELNISYKGKVKIQGVLAKSDGSFSAFGNNIRTSMKLPDECIVTADMTTCRIQITDNLVYIALRFAP